MQKVKKYLPIVVPQKYYHDQYDKPNAYFENNISIYIKSDNSIIILIRRVNYRKFFNKNFILGNNKSISEYCMLTGENFDQLKYSDITYDWNNLPSYPTCWLGMEDVRFINDKYIIPIIAERNEGGMPCLFLASLEDSTFKLVSQLDPHKIEKNWMPYMFNNKHYVIYSVSPFIIKSLAIDDCQEINIQNNLLNGYHGSTNGIELLNGDLLFIVHLYTDKTIHRWLTFNPDTLTVKVSESFQFFEHSFVESTCSLAWYHGDICVSLAVNEAQIMLAFISPNDIPLLTTL